MLINKDTKIIGENVILVPYRKEHVPKYHEWMKSEELQHLTASEPLTLEEEYEMQQSWLRDENKCTFIVLDKETYLNSNNEVEAMIGDTNLFFANSEDRLCAEAEIMIADESARGKKKGWEAMLHMFNYAIAYIGVKQFVVKISLDNPISIKMFEKMSFIEVGKSDIFKEVTYSKVVDDEWKKWIRDELKTVEIVKEPVF